MWFQRRTAIRSGSRPRGDGREPDVSQAHAFAFDILLSRPAERREDFRHVRRRDAAAVVADEEDGLIRAATAADFDPAWPARLR